MKALTAARALLPGWKDDEDLPRNHVAHARAAEHPAPDETRDVEENPAPGRIVALTPAHARSNE
ncbi:hypothetical protein [Arthrobacter sp. U41]|uniref:hypothetical protein n=1 Tax=Arthrobacter sp. U41 TaxID=1849032 RepID=UPI0008593A62|nr:hypothetical protein [Arthrobacter sp. U41]AOT02195.1 hypothetical protein ASPU41_01385 [Arthrobacter sp. U41]